MKLLRVILALFALAALAALPRPALAWGEYGHRTVASIAWAYLTPAARIEVRRLLAREATAGTPMCPLNTIEDASYWPECARGLGDRFSYSFPWHYQNNHVCGSFDVKANCPDGNCVSAQIERHARLLKDTKVPDREKLLSLAWLVHFVGDMHQPMHSGDAADRGGNNVRAAYGAKAPERMNLHRIWDSDLAERALTEPPTVTPISIAAADRRVMAAGSIAGWAREGWEVSRTVVYPQLRDFPDSCPVKSDVRPVVDAAYIAAAKAPLRLQVERAGVRLAMLLNTALAR